jgi:hypothetical protein
MMLGLVLPCCSTNTSRSKRLATLAVGWIRGVGTFALSAVRPGRV